MKKFLLFAAFTSLLGQANAEDELVEKAKALSVLKKHSETVACQTTFEEGVSLEALLKNVYTVHRDDELGDATYYVLWYGDMGCAGGSGTGGFYVSEVGRDSGSRPLLVKNNNAFGDEFSEKVNRRFIENMEMKSPVKFSVISSEFADGDANSSPSIRYQYTIERKDGWGPWKVTEKKRLE